MIAKCHTALHRADRRTLYYKRIKGCFGGCSRSISIGAIVLCSFPNGRVRLLSRVYGMSELQIYTAKKAIS